MTFLHIINNILAKRNLGLLGLFHMVKYRTTAGSSFLIIENISISIKKNLLCINFSPKFFSAGAQNQNLLCARQVPSIMKDFQYKKTGPELSTEAWS